MLLSLFLFSTAHAEGPNCAQVYAKLSLNPDPDLKAFRLEVEKITRDLPAGTPLDFGEGDRFTFQKLLGEGATTKIVKTQEGPVLRISKRVPDAYPGTDLNGFNRLQGELEAAGVPIVKVDREHSRLPKFLIVEEKKILGTLYHYLHPNFKGATEAERKFALSKLDDFARKTWGFSYIGDFNPSQLGFDGKEWFLFDVGMVNSPISHPRQKQTVFSSWVDEGDTLRTVPAEMEDHLVKIIREERERHQEFATRPWFTRVKYAGDHKLLVNNESTGLVLNHNIPYLIETEFLTKRGRKKLLGKSPTGQLREIRLKAQNLLRTGEKSALYEVTVGKKQALLEVRLEIDKKKDLFSGKMPLLKKEGYSEDDLIAIGPDFVLLLK